MPIDDRGDVERKPSLLRSLARILVTDDPQTLGNDIIKVIGNSARRTVVDVVAKVTLGRTIFGDDRVSNVINGPVDYTRPSTVTSTPLISSSNSNTILGSVKFKGTVFFKDSASAYDVRDKMLALLAENGRVRVLDLYQEAEIPGITYVNANYGWTDLTGMTVYPSGDGFILHMPPEKNIS